MYFTNHAPSPRTLTILKGRTDKGRAKAEAIHVLPKQEIDLSSEELFAISQNRAAAAIFENDFRPGRSSNAASRLMGGAARGRAEPSARMKAWMDQADRQDAEPKPQSDATEQAADDDAAAVQREIEGEQDRVLTGRQVRKIEVGRNSGIVVPPDLRISASDAASIARKTELATETVPETLLRSEAPAALDPDSVSVGGFRAPLEAGDPVPARGTPPASSHAHKGGGAKGGSNR